MANTTTMSGFLDTFRLCSEQAATKKQETSFSPNRWHVMPRKAGKDDECSFSPSIVAPRHPERSRGILRTRDFSTTLEMTNRWAESI